MNLSIDINKEWMTNLKSNSGNILARIDRITTNYLDYEVIEAK